MFSDVEDRSEPKVKWGKPGGVTNGSWARVGRMKQHGIVSEKFIKPSLELFSFALKVFQSGACETTQPFSECDKKRGQRMRGTSEWELQEFSEWRNGPLPQEPRVFGAAGERHHRKPDLDCIVEELPPEIHGA